MAVEVIDDTDEDVDENIEVIETRGRGRGRAKGRGRGRAKGRGRGRAKGRGRDRGRARGSVRGRGTTFHPDFLAQVQGLAIIGPPSPRITRSQSTRKN